MPISTMKKLTVLAYSSDADAIVRRLMDIKCVQIRQADAENSGALIEAPTSDPTRAELEGKLATIRSALPALTRYTRRKSTLGRRVHRVNRAQFVADGRAERAYGTVSRTLETVERLEAMQVEKERNASLMQSLLPWLEYDAPLSSGGSLQTGYALGSSPAKQMPTEALEAAGAYVEPVSGEAGEWYFAVTYHRDDTEAVERALAACGFVKVSFDGVDTTAQIAYDRLEARQTELEGKIMDITDQLVDLADGIDDVEILYDVEETSLNVHLQKQKLLRTKHCIVLEGWIPENRTDSLTSVLSRFECVCDLEEVEEGEEAPVLLKNNSFSSTFEWVIGMYSYPKYGTFDPTLIMSIFYFLIFGMMFADVGYGLLLALGAFGGAKLLNPRAGMKQMLYMFGYCGISCMLMGVLFGGWFGNLPTAIMNSFFPVFEGQAELTPIGSFFYNGLIFNPVDSSTSFLVLALAAGEIHLIAGMAVNMFITWRNGKPLQAICENVPYWILFAGLDLMAPVAIVGMLLPGGADAETMALLNQLSGIGGYLAIAGGASILLFKGLGEKSVVAWLVKGLGGLYSLISFASDLLSYSRILALGLVASVIAQVINMLTGLGATGPLGFVFMLIVMIVGHVLNLAINLLGTFVHAARLQYIEFFGKFYEDGGEPFSPALPAENYSEDCNDVPN